jgi:hypothetical protein
MPAISEKYDAFKRVKSSSLFTMKVPLICTTLSSAILLLVGLKKGGVFLYIVFSTKAEKLPTT